MFKRLLACMTAIVVMITSLAPLDSVSAASANASHSVDSGAETASLSGNGAKPGELSVKGTSGFGQLLADKLSVQAAKQLESNGCNIFSVEMDGRIANVSFETVEDAAIIVGIYDESGVQMLSFASANVSAWDTQVQVTMENSLPCYFLFA